MEQQPNTEAPQGAVPLDCKVRDRFEDAEQAVLEDWLHKTCPSGDVEEVQRKWLESYEYREFLDEQEPFFQNAVYAAAGGMTQTAIER